MIDFGEFCSEIFQVLRAYGTEIVLYDRDGKRVYEPNEARRFYVIGANILISIKEAGDNSALKLYLSNSINISQLTGFIDTLRNLTVSANLLFHVKKFNKEIKPQDFSTKVSVNEQENLNMDLMEGLYGTSKSSYLKLENARMIVRHSAKINERMIGSRGRNIHSIFIENAVGERQLFPVNLLSGARAMTQHVNQGGTFADEVGQQIVRMAQDFRNMAIVNTYGTKNAVAQPDVFATVVESITRGMKQLKYAFSRIYEARTYQFSADKLRESNSLMEDDSLAGAIEAWSAILGEGVEQGALASIARQIGLPSVKLDAEPEIELEIDDTIEENIKNSTVIPKSAMKAGWYIVNANHEPLHGPFNSEEDADDYAIENNCQDIDVSHFSDKRITKIDEDEGIDFGLDESTEEAGWFVFDPKTGATIDGPYDNETEVNVNGLGTQDVDFSVAYGTTDLNGWFHASQLIENSDSDSTKIDIWQDEVRSAYPEVALVFKGKSENGKNLISAEVEGQDRCYGVFDLDTESGEVLTDDINYFESQVVDTDAYATIKLHSWMNDLKSVKEGKSFKKNDEEEDEVVDRKKKTGKTIDLKKKDDVQKSQDRKAKRDVKESEAIKVINEPTIKQPAQRANVIHAKINELKDDENETSIHDLKSIVQATDLKLKSMSSMDPEYKNVLAKKQSAEAKLKKTTRYGKPVMESAGESEFSSAVVRTLESIIGEEIQDNVDILNARKTQNVDASGNVVYHASIGFDGKDNKGHRGNVLFTTNVNESGRVENFKIINLTGTGYNQVPDSINETQLSEYSDDQDNVNDLKAQLQATKAKLSSLGAFSSEYRTTFAKAEELTKKLQNATRYGKPVLELNDQEADVNDLKAQLRDVKAKLDTLSAFSPDYRGLLARKQNLEDKLKSETRYGKKVMELNDQDADVNDMRNQLKTAKAKLATLNAFSADYRPTFAKIQDLESKLKGKSHYGKEVVAEDDDDDSDQNHEAAYMLADQTPDAYNSAAQFVNSEMNGKLGDLNQDMLSDILFTYFKDQVEYNDLYPDDSIVQDFVKHTALAKVADILNLSIEESSEEIIPTNQGADLIDEIKSKDGSNQADIERLRQAANPRY